MPGGISNNAIKYKYCNNICKKKKSMYKMLNINKSYI